MSQDPRHYGGQEYAPAPQAHTYDAPLAHPYTPPPVEAFAPVPQTRPAPAAYQPQVAPAQPVPQVAPAYAPVAASAPPAPATPARENEVLLSKHYSAHDEEVDRITLRRPITRDIKKLGNPVKIQTNADGIIVDMDMRWDIVAKYISVLSTPPLPPSTVDQFEYEDLDACAGLIAGFFVKLVR